MSNLDWNAISALAAVVASCAAVTAVWVQGRWTRFSIGVQIAWELEQKLYHDPTMIARRRSASAALLSGTVNEDAIEMANFFDSVGIFLRRKVIDDDVVISAFYRRAAAYWHFSEEHRNGLRKTDPGLWDDFEFLIDQCKAEVERRQRKLKKREGYRTALLEAGKDLWSEVLRRESQVTGSVAAGADSLSARSTSGALAAAVWSSATDEKPEQ